MSENSNDTQPDGAEATDGTTLGEEIGDDIRPGTVGFPPTTPSGVGAFGTSQDADHVDSVHERSEREEEETLPSPPDEIRLTDTDTDGDPESVSSLIADDVPAVGLVSPEEAAMRYQSDE